MTNVVFPVDSRQLFIRYQQIRFGGFLKVRSQREWSNYVIRKFGMKETVDFVVTTAPARSGGQPIKVSMFSQCAADLILAAAENPKRYHNTVLKALANHAQCLDSGEKQCSRCGIFKPISEYRLISKIFGQFFESWCQACYNDRKRANRTERYKSLRGSLVVQWQNIQRRVRIREMPCDIDIDFLIDLWHAQNGRCAYSGLPMSYVRVPRRSRLRHGRTDPSIVSVDRIESRNGYTRDNVVLCRWDVNFMKNELSLQHFVFLAGKVARFGRREKNKKNDDGAHQLLLPSIGTIT